jgi:hypothetical protein
LPFTLPDTRAWSAPPASSFVADALREVVVGVLEEHEALADVGPAGSRSILAPGLAT